MLVKLPRSALNRNCVTHIKLLDHVDEYAHYAFGFEGRFLRPGSSVPLAQLPDPCVLLECAGSLGRGKGSLRIIWRLDRARGEWIEVARAVSTDWSWSLALRPIALSELRGGVAAPAADVPAIAGRVVALLDLELHRIAPGDRGAVLSAIDPEIAGRIVEWCELSLSDVPVRRGGVPSRHPGHSRGRAGHRIASPASGVAHPHD